MSEDQPASYRIDYIGRAGAQLREIAATLKKAGKSREFIALLKTAVHLLKTDPHGWGDPQYRSKFVDGLHCQGLLRPIVFRYVIYEQIHGVVLLSVQIFADFN